MVVSSSVKVKGQLSVSLHYLREAERNLKTFRSCEASALRAQTQRPPRTLTYMSVLHVTKSWWRDADWTVKVVLQLHTSNNNNDNLGFGDCKARVAPNVPRSCTDSRLDLQTKRPTQAALVGTAASSRALEASVSLTWHHGSNCMKMRRNTTDGRFHWIYVPSFVWCRLLNLKSPLKRPGTSHNARVVSEIGLNIMSHTHVYKTRLRGIMKWKNVNERPLWWGADVSSLIQLLRATSILGQRHCSLDVATLKEDLGLHSKIVLGLHSKSPLASLKQTLCVLIFDS